MTDIGDGAALGSLIISGWAAWTAHQARSWQREADQRRERIDVRVEFEHSSDQITGVWSINVDDPDPRPHPIGYRLTLNVVNDGPTSVWLQALYVQEARDGEEDGVAGVDFDAPFRKGDVEVRPRERFSHAFWVEYQRHHIDFDKGFVGIARLATGEMVESEREVLMEDIQQHIREFNETARPR